MSIDAGLLNNVDHDEQVLVVCPLCKTHCEKKVFDIDASSDVRHSHFYTCKSCSLEYAGKTVSADSEHYEQLEFYDRRWEFSRVFAETRLRDGKILEVGCGEGFFIEEANRHGNFVVGLDFNKQAVAKAIAKGLQAEIRCVNVDHLKELATKNEKFAMIAVFHVIEHLDNLSQFVTDCLALLSRNGFFVLAVPSQRRFNAKIKRHEWWDKPPHHLTRWHRRSFREFARRYNLTIDHIIYQQINPKEFRAQFTGWIYRKVFGWLGNRGVLYHTLSLILTPFYPLLTKLNSRYGTISGNSVLVIMRNTPNNVSVN